jgi:amidase
VDADDVAFAGTETQAEMVRRGEVSSRELVEIALGRVARWEPRLRACTSVRHEALVVADEADRRRRGGELRPLLGVPLVVKDNVDVAGTVTSHGTAAMTKPAWLCLAAQLQRAADWCERRPPLAPIV